MSELVRRMTEVLDKLTETTVSEATPVPADGVQFDLTIGIATYDDFDGAWFTINALMMYHPEAMARAEIVLLDNHPRGRESTSLKELDGQAPHLRYIPITSVQSTAIRDLVFRHARGRVVIVLDSHVLLDSGSLDAVLTYFDDPAHSADLVQGPMLAVDSRGMAATHWTPGWSRGMFGQWATDPRVYDGEVFDIPLQGLATFACLRESWPGLNPRFRGFGGEEGYLHEKFRARGGRTVCLPSLRWSHRFPRPRGVPYPINWRDRIRNYAIGWSEVGLDIEPMFDHFREYLGEAAVGIIDDVRRELAEPALAFDGVLVINDDLRPGAWRATAATLQARGLSPRRVATVESESPEVSTTLSLRATLEHARDHGWQSAVIVGDRVREGDPALAAITDGSAWTDHSVTLLAPLDGPLDSVAIVVREPAISRLLARLPATAELAAQWPERQHLSRVFTEENR